MSEKYQVYLDIFLSADAKIASVATKGGLSPPEECCLQLSSIFEIYLRDRVRKTHKNLFLKKN